MVRPTQHKARRVPANVDSPRRVLVVTFPGTLLLDVAGPAQVFETAARVAEARHGWRPYELIAASLRGGAIVTDTGIAVHTVPPEVTGAIDTLLVPGGVSVPEEQRNAALLLWIAEVAAGARRVASVCLGAFLLAAAGLLDGKRVVTHWQYCAELKARYPALRVESEPIFLRDGTTWTSAGVSAGIDLALALVEEDLGHDLALDVARRLVVFLKRPGGQSQSSRALAAQLADRTGDFDSLHAWIVENLANDLRVERLAERAGMSPRNFARQYAACNGQTPARAIASLRLEAARRMLATQLEVPIAHIAERCGYGNYERMRRAFLRSLGIPPAEYRRRFAIASK